MAITSFKALSKKRPVNGDVLSKNLWRSWFPHWQETHYFLSLLSSPLPIERVCQRSKRVCLNNCRGQSPLQAGAGDWSHGSQNGGIVWQPRRPQTTPCYTCSIAHLSIKNARNTMGTRGTLEWHLGLVAPMVRRPSDLCVGEGPGCWKHLPPMGVMRVRPWAKVGVGHLV